MSDLGQEATLQLHDIDLGIRLLIEGIAMEVADGISTEEQACAFFDAIRSLSESSEEALDSVQYLIDQFASVETLSREIRPPMRVLRHGLTLMMEGRAVMRQWVTLSEATGIVCHGSETSFFE